MCFFWGGGGVARVPVVMGDSRTKQIGVACKSCGVAISWESNYGPSCGETFPFQPKVKRMPVQGGGVPTREQAARDYERIQSQHAYKQNMLAAAFAAGESDSKSNDENASPALPLSPSGGAGSTVAAPNLKRKKRGKNTGVARRQGTVVKAHTFASYGVPTTKSKQKRTRTERKVLKEQTPARATRPRRRKRQSAYDASLARLLD